MRDALCGPWRRWATVCLVAAAVGAATPGVRLSAQDARGTVPDTLRLSLADAARMAGRLNPGVTVAEERSAQAAAGVMASRSSFLPALSAFTGRSARTFNTASFGLEFPAIPGQPPLFDPEGQVEGPVTTIDAGARVSIKLLDWSSVERLRGARSAASAAATDIDASVLMASNRASEAYVSAERAEALLRSHGCDLELARDLLGIASDLVRAGVGVALDETRARSQVAAIRAQLIGDRNRVAQTRLRLAHALGVAPATPIVLLDSLATPGSGTPVDVDALVREAWGSRPELSVLDRRMEAARHQVAAARSERYPTLVASGSDAVTGKKYGRLLNTYQWSFQVSVPVFNGMRTRADRARASAAVAELEARRRDLAAQVEVEVRSALLSLEAARAQVAASGTNLELAELQVAQARDRFEAGVAGNADLVTASLALSRARAARVQALAAFQMAAVELFRARGITLGRETGLE